MSIKGRIAKAADRGRRTLARLARRVVTKARQAATVTYASALGVTRYRWRTQGDARVRDAHRAIEGQVFDLSTGHPSEGHPGEPYNCRCSAELIAPPNPLIRQLFPLLTR